MLFPNAPNYTLIVPIIQSVHYASITLHNILTINNYTTASSTMLFECKGHLTPLCHYIPNT